MVLLGSAAGKLLWFGAENDSKMFTIVYSCHVDKC